jgi:hypothetical protein
MFEQESYWRDLLSFTWNIITLAGKEKIKAMLEATVAEAKPGQWRIEGNAASENGVISSWFTFETADDQVRYQSSRAILTPSVSNHSYRVSEQKKS